MKKSFIYVVATALSVFSAFSFADSANDSTNDSAAMNSVSAGLEAPTGIEAQTGKEIYETICISCHMAEGKGAQGATARFPAFENNPSLAAGGYPAYVVLYGQKGMPGFGNYFNDNQVAAIVNYIRTHFGNEFEPAFSAAEVAEMRKPDADYGTLD